MRAKSQLTDFVPNAPPASLDWSQDPVQLPTVPGKVEAIESSVADLLKNLNQTVTNANKLIEPNSVLDTELINLLNEGGDAARSVRVLADYLERHPEALIRGKTGEAK